MRNYSFKRGVFVWFPVLGVLVLMAAFAGCGDNPESKAAKEVRNQTEKAVRTQTGVQEDYASSQQKVMAALVRNRAEGLTKDAALLASGNLAFARGRQMLDELRLKVLPIRGSIDVLEQVLRRSEQALIEKERIEKLLASGEQEIAELNQLIDGDGQSGGLKAQLQQLQEQMEGLASEKTQLQDQQSQVQAVLDEQQSRADTLLRQAELAGGDRRLSLEQQAFEILKGRKEAYVRVQAMENQIGILDGRISLLQTQLDNVGQSIRQAQERIEQINASDTRLTLKRQQRDLEEAISVDQQQFAGIAREIGAGYQNYQELAGQVGAVFRESMSEFEKVGPKDAAFTAFLGAAGSAYHAGLTCGQKIQLQNYLRGRLERLIKSTDPAFAEALNTALTLPGPIQDEQKKEIFELFDQSIQNYEEAASRAARLEAEASCDIAKSILLVLHSKMKAADLLEEYDLATATEVLIDQKIEAGKELGDCFTQSEALLIVQSGGLDYMPSIPLNMQVFVEGKKQELSAWKRLPLAEQEAAVDENLRVLDELVAQYGQEFAQELEPVKQEMLTAKERGFKELAPGAGEPNSI